MKVRKKRDEGRVSRGKRNELKGDGAGWSNWDHYTREQNCIF